MGLGKKDITLNISSKTQLSLPQSKDFLNSFISLIKFNLDKDIKISKFGTFKSKLTPQRIGRNPKTKEEYLIPKKNRIYFHYSMFVRKLLN